MLVQISRLASVLVLVGLCVVCADPSNSQEVPIIRGEQGNPPAELPKGIEVQARGPIHEAFASPSTEPKATQPIPKKPPTPIEEMPPDEKPDGDVTWIGGYFAWDDDRADFMWVSGCWRIKPAGKEWVPGYWREVNDQWQWVPGFWTNAAEGKAESVTYYPDPPAPPNIAPAGDAPGADMFYVPGYWMWNGDRYIWRVGFWSRVRPGYVYVPSHYRWTPSGQIFIAGYWDLAVSRRGVLYSPVAINFVVVGPRYVYTPYYAVRDTLVLDTMFIRPAHGHYYYGDYYGPRYVSIGFEPCVVYSRRHYEPIMVYERWHYRDNPRWLDIQIALVSDRHSGRVALPPRVLNVTNITVVNNYIAPTRVVMAAQGVKTVRLDVATRNQVRQAAMVAHERVSTQRLCAEVAHSGGPLSKPHSTPLAVTTPHPIGSHPGGTGGLTKTPGTGGLTKTPVNPMITHPMNPITHPVIGGNPIRDVKGNPIHRPKEDPKKKKTLP